MMKRLFLIIAFWAAGVAGASAQMRLTLPQALDLALSENPTVKVAEMEVQRYDYVKRQTWGNLLPQISASGSYTRSIVKSEMRAAFRSEPITPSPCRATCRCRSSRRRSTAR